MSSTSKWLRELGAVRPMAPAGETVLVLGKWSEGFYPIQWTQFHDTTTRDFNGRLMNREPIEQWRILGFLTHQAVTKEDCERILRSVRGELKE